MLQVLQEYERDSRFKKLQISQTTIYFNLNKNTFATSLQMLQATICFNLNQI